VVVAYHDAAPGSSIGGSLTAISASPGRAPEARTREFAVATTPGTGSATIAVSVFFSRVPCAASSSAEAAIQEPNGAGSAAAGFGQGCTAG
jgi:hypothetical protein